MFHVKHFGTIGARVKLQARGAARYEAGIWGKRKIAIELKFSASWFLEPIAKAAPSS
jgi:hypothetical protein